MRMMAALEFLLRAIAQHYLENLAFEVVLADTGNADYTRWMDCSAVLRLLAPRASFASAAEWTS